MTRVSGAPGRIVVKVSEIEAEVCPACQAEPKKLCWQRFPNGGKIPQLKYHTARRNAAVARKQRQIRQTQMSIRATLQEFDKNEYLQLRDWLQGNVHLLLDLG